MSLLLYYFAVFAIISKRVDAAQAPQITPARLPDVMEEGQRLAVTCAVFTGTLPISFSWRKSNTLLTSTSDVKIVHLDEYQEQLLIPRLTVEHIGNYTCSAKNSYGTDQMAVSVILKFRPKWTANVSETISSVSGHNVSLDCTASGHPSPTIEIRKGVVRSRVRADSRLSSRLTRVSKTR